MNSFNLELKNIDDSEVISVVPSNHIPALGTNIFLMTTDPIKGNSAACTSPWKVMATESIFDLDYPQLSNRVIITVKKER